jgi:hypothetical protein
MAARKTIKRVRTADYDPVPTIRPNGVQRFVETAISSGQVLSVGVLDLVRTTLVTALAGARDVGAELGTVAVSAVRGSIRAAHEIGSDVGAVVRSAIRGTIEAAEEIGGDLGGVAKSATRGAVRATGDIGGDVGMVARRAVEGTVDAARALGVDVNKLARSAGEGAVEAADRISSVAGRSVRRTLSETIAGVKGLVGVDSPTASRRGGARAPSRRRAAATAPKRRRARPSN